MVKIRNQFTWNTLKKNIGIPIKKCVLIIDKGYPFFGASPGELNLTTNCFSN
jgi:hypothetical protein